MGGKKIQPGDKFGRLSAQYLAYKKLPNGRNRSYWVCICECGAFYDVESGNLRSGNTKACRRCAAIDRSMHRVKPYRDHRVYAVWKGMRDRCVNQNNRAYKRYGGSGVSVCDRWKNSFDAFVEDMGLPQPGESIDRIDPSKNYEPCNCRWADNYTQANNKKTTKYIEAWGKRQTLSQWCRELGLKYDRVKARLNVYGMEPEMALSQGTLVRKNKYIADGVEYDSLKQIAESKGLSVSGVHGRMKSEQRPEWYKI